MRLRDTLFLAIALILSAVALAFLHYVGDASWLTSHVSTSLGGDGILWQVQTTFLSVGFAGLAIAAQLFAEAPLAVGASRGRVLEYVRANWFVGIGLAANVAIAIEVIWLPSSAGLLFVALLGFVPTIALLMLSTTRLAQLFGHPSRLDEVVRQSLVTSLSGRLSEASRKYSDAARGLEDLARSDWTTGSTRAKVATFKVLGWSSPCSWCSAVSFVLVG